MYYVRVYVIVCIYMGTIYIYAQTGHAKHANQLHKLSRPYENEEIATWPKTCRINSHEYMTTTVVREKARQYTYWWSVGTKSLYNPNIIIPYSLLTPSKYSRDSSGANGTPC